MTETKFRCEFLKLGGSFCSGCNFSKFSISRLEQDAYKSTCQLINTVYV